MPKSDLQYLHSGNFSLLFTCEQVGNHWRLLRIALSMIGKFELES
jgi:hypothetical protein